MISTTLFSDERFLGLNTHQRLLFLGLLTFENGGKVKLGPNQLTATVFGCDHSANPSDVRIWLARLAADGLIDSGEWNDQGRIHVLAYHETDSPAEVCAAIREAIEGTSPDPATEPEPAAAETAEPVAAAPVPDQDSRNVQIAKFVTTLEVEKRLDAEQTLRQIAAVTSAKRIDWARLWGCFEGCDDPISESARMAEWVTESRGGTVKRPFAMVSSWMKKWRKENQTQDEGTVNEDYAHKDYDPYSGVIAVNTTSF